MQSEEAIKYQEDTREPEAQETEVSFSWSRCKNPGAPT